MTSIVSIHHFFDKNTDTFTYIVSDPDSGECAIIDPVLDYDAATGVTSTQSAENVISYIQQHNLTVEWLLETHAHADHLSSAHYLKERLGGKIGIGEHILKVVDFWVPLFNTAHDTPQDGSQFDHLFKDEGIFTIGSIEVRTLHTPGHTPACISYLIGDDIFVGDTIFMPYAGTARTDFPGGSASDLYHSIQKILSLPASTKIHSCHDYPPKGIAASSQSTVAQQKEGNCMIADEISEKEYHETIINAPRNKDWHRHANEHWQAQSNTKLDKQSPTEKPNYNELADEDVFGSSVQENPSIDKFVSGKDYRKKLSTPIIIPDYLQSSSLIILSR
jgi:glyoxylase-like metal-dependent hydrolase (beta-lactamase superfamily II)